MTRQSKYLLPLFRNVPAPVCVCRLPPASNTLRRGDHLEEIMHWVVETTRVILHHVTHKSLNSEDMLVCWWDRGGAQPATPHTFPSSGKFRPLQSGFRLLKDRLLVLGLIVMLLFLVTEMQPRLFKWCLIKTTTRTLTLWSAEAVIVGFICWLPIFKCKWALIHSSSINTDMPIVLLAGSDQRGRGEGRAHRQQLTFWGSAAASCLLQARSRSSSSCSRRLNLFPPESREDTRCRPVRSGPSTPRTPSVCMRSSEKVSGWWRSYAGHITDWLLDRFWFIIQLSNNAWLEKKGQCIWIFCPLFLNKSRA